MSPPARASRCSTSASRREAGAPARARCAACLREIAAPVVPAGGGASGELGGVDIGGSLVQQGAARDEVHRAAVVGIDQRRIPQLGPLVEVGRVEFAVDAKPIPGGRAARRQGKPFARGPVGDRRFELPVDATCRGRPQPEADAGGRDPWFEPRRQVMPANTSTARGGARSAVARSKIAETWSSSAVSSSRSQRLKASSFGRTKSIASGAALSTM